jgi:exodeoxyribonuclease VIII
MKLELGIQDGVPNAVYHADRKCVSSTWLKKVQKTPFHLRSYLDSPPSVPSPALIMGQAVDTLVFEPELWDKEFIIAPEINRRTKAGREEWESLIDGCSKSNRTLISNADHFEALQTAKAIRTNPVMVDILSSGKTQQTFIWRDPATELLCKCRSDWYDEKTKTIYDLKTALDGSPEAFSKAIANFGYHIQAAFYSDGIRACGKPVERFVFCVMEKPNDRDGTKASPELMSFYELNVEDIQAGQDSYSSGLAAINFCIMTNDWSGYTDQILPIGRPAWARRNDMELITAL